MMIFLNIVSVLCTCTTLYMYIHCIHVCSQFNSLYRIMRSSIVWVKAVLLTSLEQNARRQEERLL